MQLKQGNSKMEIKIITEKENKLFGRKEFDLELESNSHPSREEVKKLISEKLSSPEENIVVKKIDSKFGSNTFLIRTFVYNSEEEKNKTEPKPKTAKKKE